MRRFRLNDLFNQTYCNDQITGNSRSSPSTHGMNSLPAHTWVGMMCAAGDVQAGDLGLGAVPGREAEFRQGLDLALDYARALSCKR